MINKSLWLNIGQLTQFSQFSACFAFSSLSNPDLIWKYADWLLEKDQNLGVQVRTVMMEIPSNSILTDYLALLEKYWIL
jgi:hypothetical protein